MYVLWICKWVRDFFFSSRRRHTRWNCDWSSDVCSSDLQFEDIETYPKPIQDPLPIYRAGHGEEVFKWIARYGQGWIDSTQKPEEATGYIERLKALGTEAGRDGNALEIVRQWYVSIAETEAEANAVYA